MLQGGAKDRNLGISYLTFIFLEKVLFRIDCLTVTSDCRVLCPRVGLKIKI